jgi:hypothetical protein
MGAAYENIWIFRVQILAFFSIGELNEFNKIK